LNNFTHAVVNLCGTFPIYTLCKLSTHQELQPVIFVDDTRILVTVRSTEEIKTKINSTLDYMID